MKDPRVYLAHILQCIDRILSYTAGGRQVFLDQPVIQDAVIRNFEIIGEAAKRVPDDYREAHPDIPWRSLAGFRDVLIHEYEEVDVERVWRVVEADLPSLRGAMAALVPPLDQLESDIAGE